MSEKIKKCCPSILQKQFDSYCKKVIIWRATKQIRNYMDYCRKYSAYSLEDVDEDTMSTTNKFAVEESVIRIGNEDIAIENDSLAEAIMELQENLREVLLMNVVLDRSLSEIAKEKNLTYETVRVYKSAALKKLRKRVDNERR